MALFASANGARLVTMMLTWSMFGCWVADVVGADDTPISGAVSLTVANLTLSGAAFRTGAFAGQTRARIIGGAGGWRKEIRRQPYRIASGVPLHLVLRDAAIECGETLGTVDPAITIGTNYVREQGPAARVLRHLVGRRWWIDEAGVTQIGARPAKAVASEFLIEKYFPELGKFIVATEDLAAWVPGATFSNRVITDTRTVSSVSVGMHEGGALRLEVLA